MEALENKAELLPKRFTKMCAICMLIDSEAPKDMVFHVFKEGFTADEDEYVCSTCVADVMQIRKLCNQKIDNPHHDNLSKFVPTFIKENVAMMKGYLEQKG